MYICMIAHMQIVSTDKTMYGNSPVTTGQGDYRGFVVLRTLDASVRVRSVSAVRFTPILYHAQFRGYLGVP